MHIISNNNNSAPQGHQQNNNNNKNFIWRSKMKKDSLPSVVAAAKDVVFSFSSCAWSVGGYGDSQERSDEINRQNVWQCINGIYIDAKQKQSGLFLFIQNC